MKNILNDLILNKIYYSKILLSEFKSSNIKLLYFHYLLFNDKYNIYSIKMKYCNLEISINNKFYKN